MGLVRALEKLHDRKFSSITEVESGLRVSGTEFQLLIEQRMLRICQDYDPQPNWPVLLIASNDIRFFINFFALYFLNVPIIPLSEEIKQFELDKMISLFQPKLVINNSNETLLTNFKPLDVEAALILFTSGSVGHPKGVIITQDALEKKFNIFSQNIGLDNIRNTLCFIPTSFGHGLIGNSIWPILNGENFYISKKLGMDQALQITAWIQRHEINFFSSVPSHWELILRTNKKIQSTSLKRVQCASAPLLKEKIERITDWLPEDADFFDVYGATEMLSWFAQRNVRTSQQLSSFSSFWDARERILKTGELVLSAEYMYSGYLQDRVFSPMNEFYTGDIFENNRMVGRLKNVINKNGIKLFCDDLNSIYLNSNFLEEIASFPILDPLYGEKIGVIVILKKESSMDDFKAYCHLNISSLFTPHDYISVNKIPKNDRGKTTPDLLIQTYTELKKK